ncbi:MAG: transcriptional regulator [Methylobacter sp.]|nr:MAG: transcriptional regulator [Methylobacter sp.]PPD20477.1 MAG: transcriptional regulator [Methylobacter sp.]PPD36799.1 MAG: transcriptional regulator [Methylomonas sp.]
MNRLFSIIQVLQTAKKPVKAKELAEILEVSVRTVYRDIAELQAQKVPVHGEAGIGYVLKDGFTMPPLMLTPDELEAALLGSQWVARCGDKTLEAGAKTLMAKIHALLPGHLRQVIHNSAVCAAPRPDVIADRINMTELRTAIRTGKKVAIVYQTQNQCSERTVWPFMIGYFENTRVLAAWCELRSDFRHFRTDRIEKVEIKPESVPKPVKQLKAEWLAVEKTRIS